ncbi:MAG TPA: AraC family transcriptional regulator [Noviherbaspirillum sp.]|uniref:AraC family transcriptional regulator n=1 Tax=Noviherbaspirillum sp. TaxID=1926288 RepID=UPI002D5D9FAB|nr:AraC family transcriptional regulator [Noviherbaspirillum sp.]HYD95876.1 AraC family transcriptional regulator [Noviherbaspirillum sp.]
MTFADFTRGTASVRVLVAFGQEHGLAPAALLAGSRLSLAQLVDPNVELSAAQELAVIGNLVRLLKRPAGLGFLAGARYHFSTYGIWGYGVVSSPTAADALALALRFLPLTYAFARIGYHEAGESGVIRFGEPEVAPELRRFLVERDMAAAAVLLREVAGTGFSLSRFTLACAPGELLKLAPELERIFGLRPEFGAAANSLAFERAFLGRPLPQADPATFSMCRQMCSQLLERRRSRLGTAALVGQYLGAGADAAPTLAQLARRMNTSERTLKRRLKDEGTTFRAIRAESRRALATELLSDDSRSLTDIAETLGFSDLSSFSQAFKRWYGMAPSKFRSAGGYRALPGHGGPCPA